MSSGIAMSDHECRDPTTVTDLPVSYASCRILAICSLVDGCCTSDGLNSKRPSTDNY
jgi:hypothetical protein